MTEYHSRDYLVTGDSKDPFLPVLIEAINEAAQIDFAVAFIKSTGLALIYQALSDARNSGAKIRILTGDYLYVTDPDALRELLILKEDGADVRVFESEGQSFHMKAYIFAGLEDKEISNGLAFIGSSNISRSALTHGLEWNIRVIESDNPKKFREIREKFGCLFGLPQSKPLTLEWISEYSKRVKALRQIRVEVPGADETLPPPDPWDVQIEALDALANTRKEGYQRGLVVLATGMGKTWLAAFDTKAMNAQRVLFVAHREEILTQAENTFVRIHKDRSVGRYTGVKRELGANMLFASIQTLGKTNHLKQFRKDFFDYIIVDEFHHAAARTYRQLLAHFNPRFLLGLTATPDRTDQSDILALCDNNLVYSRDLIYGVSEKLLCPFHYYGIGDDTVNYANIPWRSGRFDPASLENQLATINRAQHILKTWREKKLSRTLAFCVSQKHSDFMAEYFSRHGVRAVSVHSDSAMRRSTALNLLESGNIDIIFSVDLFNEGVDIPCIDTILMIRPTESKIIFLQQLGRGLRNSEESKKEHLVILDFIGNHISFFKKAEALFEIGKTNQDRRDFLRNVKTGSIKLPPGCYLNYDLKAINFLDDLIRNPPKELQVELYDSLVSTLEHRPSLSEFYRAGGNVQVVRNECEGWFHFVERRGDLSKDEKLSSDTYNGFLIELETTNLVKSFKLVLLEAFLDLNGLVIPPDVKILSKRSFEIIIRRIDLHSDLPPRFLININDYGTISRAWEQYWKQNPVNAWIGGNKQGQKAWFVINSSNQMEFQHPVSEAHISILEEMLQELCDYRYHQYRQRPSMKPTQVEIEDAENIQIPYFTDLRVACGHFKTSPHEYENIQFITLTPKYRGLDSGRHFVATAHGDSMDGGSTPIKDGDFLLLEYITPISAGSNSGKIVLTERYDTTGDGQYLLRYVVKNGPSDYILRARNKNYDDLPITEDMITFARLRSIIDPLDVVDITNL